MWRSVAPIVALVLVVHTCPALLTSTEAIEDETILVRERRYTNGDEKWTHSITEKSSTKTEVSPSNQVEKTKKPIVLKPLQLTLVHKSVYTLKPEDDISSRLERNSPSSSSYSCILCSLDQNDLFERSIGRSGKLFAPTAASPTSSFEINGIKDQPTAPSSNSFSRNWKSYLYKPRKSVVRGFLASPGNSIKKFAELSLISKYNENNEDKKALGNSKGQTKKVPSSKFTVVPAVVQHIPLSFDGTNEIFHNLLVKFVRRKANENDKKHAASYENNEIRRVGIPLSHSRPHNHINSHDLFQSSIYRPHRQIDRRPQIVPATLVFKHSTSSHGSHQL